MLLLETQRRFFDAVREPLCGDDRALADLPPGTASHSAAFLATADTLLRSTEALHARERLGLYHRQYWFRLIDSLAEDFPRVRELLGADACLAAIERYLRARPPASWTLRHLGSGFADFLRNDSELASPLRPWAADLAAYEYAHMQVFEAALLPSPADTDFAERQITLQPSVILVSVNRPISRLLRPRRKLVPFAPPDAVRRELHVVWRSSGHALRARREPLSLYPLLHRLRLGGTLEKIIADTHPLPRPVAIQIAFARWRSLGWLALSPAPFS
jgi:hypothetical protein